MPPRRTAATRRRVLGGGLALTGAAVLATGGAAPSAAESGEPDFDALARRARDLLTGGDFDPGDSDYGGALDDASRTAAEFWDAMDRSADRTALWDDLGPPSDPAGFNTAYSRLQRITLAWATPGTDQHGDAAVADGVADALELLHREGYNADAERTGNWYWWEIGSPAALMRTCVLLGDRISAEQLAAYIATVDRWCPDADVRPTAADEPETGANRADKAAILALRGILGRSPGKLRQARDGLTDEAGGGARSVFGTVTEGDGFHADGSFLQHGHVPSTGSYGIVLLTAVALAAALLTETEWAVAEADLERLCDSVDRAFAPFNEDGRFMDCLRGRAVARPYSSDATTGATLLTAVTALADSAAEPHRDRLRSLAKGWLERTGADAYFADADTGGVRRAKAALADADLDAGERPSLTRVYPAMDRLLVRRERWSWALAMSSNRIAAYETGSGENLRGWHTGDGMAYLYLQDDPDQYTDEFWPTANPYRYAGITADTGERAVVGLTDRLTAPLPANDVAGGAVLGDRYAAAAMDLVAEDSTLRAKKAWFVVGDVIVALGAGITAADGRAVVTAVEHRGLHADGANRLLVNGLEPKAPIGMTQELRNASWAHLDGVGGYVFPSGAAGLFTRREDRSGTWNDIEQGATTGGGDTTVHTRRYCSLWFNHWESPTDATYAYALLPAATPDQTRAWAAGPPIAVLANDPLVQAVSSDDGLITAHFWEPGEADGLVCDAAASVVVHRDGEAISVAIADSGRTTDTAVIELPYPATEVTEADDTIAVETGNRPRLTVTLEGTRGTTQTARLR